MPALSTVVYKSVEPIAESKRRRGSPCDTPQVTAETNSRMQVSANVGGSSFNEVTFYAKVGNGGWKSIGTDDTRPYRVFHDVSCDHGRRPGRPTAPWSGTTPATRRVSEQRAGHRSGAEAHHRGSGRGRGVFGTIEVRVAADPERATHVVRIERQLNGGAWQTLRTDSSSPIYTYYDDLSVVPVGTMIQYRAILTSRTAPGWSARSVRSTGRRRSLWCTASRSPAPAVRDRLPGRLGPGL